MGENDAEWNPGESVTRTESFGREESTEGSTQEEDDE